ncbi:MAG: 16S rRNA (guanine(527)-N(7))-methyltransferase RsmG [Pelagibacteraceae bacterium]|nr:16S rRNA (guanine(527)-N(7))-methyltransferase RsmG [Pelagibacteraceae bacterium]PHX89225.1 MAG: 16S rRNA (guanine(527)-N(7))-methyltransferase RsmG [Pelagibacteraceae bacterium]
MDDIFKLYSKLETLNVSRETFLDLEHFTNMVLEKNKQINIFSRKTSDNIDIRERHIIDSAQVIDFIDLNSKNITDIGAGGGMPGVVAAIIIKNMKNNTKINLYEKSHHKSSFLREVSRKLKLNIEVFEKNIFEVKKIETGTIMSRAFKPMPVVLDLVYKNFSSFNNLILFMGENGKKILKETLADWDLEFTEKKSITNEDSFLLNIKKIKKKN